MVFAKLAEHYSKWSAHRLGGTFTEPIDFLRAVASSPLEWLPPSSRLILRADPEPVIGLVGGVNQKARSLFELAVYEMRETLERSRFVTHNEVADLARALANKLEPDLRRHPDGVTLVPVPRGGHFVAGYLSYFVPVRVLGEFSVPNVSGEVVPILLIDDIALSGRRISDWIERFPDRKIVVATLVSTQQVRDAICTRFGDRVSWVSADDLQVYSETKPHPGETDPPPFRGLTEHCCFPWTESDRGLRLDGSSDFYTALRLIPPDLCLKNQVQFEANFDRVGIVGDEDGWLRTATGILWADIEGKVYIADTERGRSQMLEGTAAGFWNASLKHPTRKETVAYLADVYEQEPSIIEDDHRNFIAHLIDEGVLLPRQSASARASSVSRT